mmetsp:Transcript_19855/g.32639  ORF Transcript_19855/g.32639 Transcript_19855/m.32639 type:complete len:353 (-) Transcript_19855:1702-2760(-)|eukprot:CAMPEP_0203751282 /NCGR_PEP_ID=MMETSP0098-20131031/5381_1 /ASSEMBLY_ACC=CAM_ASM_000208 /TAXON_ID=96639 /ORGANISM=" , Strain NY0313808BC1" /LENGTH=352 /DNA_ID=CAMNT_0050640935 /DNA_START=83 /DNA_END=1141 /DNA_ORIENTATION=+
MTSVEKTSTEAPAAPVKEDDKLQGATSKDYYFDSYAHFGIHEEMLKDEVRTKSYMRSIVQNRHLFKDKVVLDVGCGTGILSMFAAKAGAKKVYAVDFSNIATQAKEIVQKNGLSDIVEVIHGKIEEVDLACGEGGVDIIISEWMGYFLLYESMLDSVLVARDKWLNQETGIMMPDKATMYICGIEDASYKEEKLHFWDNVYGFDMSCIKEMAFVEPLVETVEAGSIMTNCCKLVDFDVRTMKKEEVDFTADFEITGLRDDYMHAFVVYFDIEFAQCHKPITFSTGPAAKYTHWKQTIFYTREDLTVGYGETVKGTISTKQNKGNKRDLDITLSYNFSGKNQEAAESSLYRLR